MLSILCSVVLDYAGPESDEHITRLACYDLLMDALLPDAYYPDYHQISVLSRNDPVACGKTRCWRTGDQRKEIRVLAFIQRTSRFSQLFP
jgi:hypothetical protein